MIFLRKCVVIQHFSFCKTMVLAVSLMALAIGCSSIGTKEKDVDFVITDEFTHNINNLIIQYVDEPDGNIEFFPFHEGLAKIIIGPNPDEFEYCEEGRGEEYLELIKRRKEGFIDKTGKIVALFDAVESFSEGLASVKEGEKWGFIDKTGKIVIPTEYDGVKSFSEGSVGVCKYGKWGFINQKGEVIVPIEYDMVGDFREELAWVSKNGKGGYINQKGKIVVPIEYDIDYDHTSFSEGLAAICKNGKWGYVDKKGKIIIPLEYDYASNFNYKLARVIKDHKWGFIDKKGKNIIPFDYTHANDFNEGLACVKKEDKWGFIDPKGKLVIPIEYDYVHDFSEGLAWVRKDGKWGCIDKQGNFTIPFSRSYYDDVHDFKNGVATITIYDEGVSDAINKNGDIIHIGNMNYNSISEKFSEGLAVVSYGIKILLPYSCGASKNTDKRTRYAWIPGYVDRHGNSTTYEYAQKIEELYEKRFKDEVEEKIKKEQSQIKEWLQGTWDCLNNNLWQLNVSESNMIFHAFNKIAFQGPYEIIVDDQKIICSSVEIDYDQEYGELYIGEITDRNRLVFRKEQSYNRNGY